MVCSERMENRTPYAVDVMGGDRSSAISRRMSANKVLGMATSAIWKASEPAAKFLATLLECPCC
jgi:hypothetical protein